MRGNLVPSHPLFGGGAAAPELPPEVTLQHGIAWTLADYEALPADGQRYELLDGVLRVTPAPSPDHQSANGWLAFYLIQHIQVPGKGRVFSAPIDVELGPKSIVQPDLVVLLRDSAATVTARRIVGPPDLVVEITSPSTASYDRREKRDLYAAVGVREYWLVDPGTRSVELLCLEHGSYHAEYVYTGQAIVPSRVIVGWNVTTAALFVG
ncbi:MAG: Uma2 family endonuclease [Candidatus Viridilinea halotolerans]|uniref:Uma2 family endonuclease n=1 Tax=Candidatus Viridilinea halotolerans TaxID=2491704 RepID=A0A426UC20_9CHLR|nr:MAG: Uma2 family endonuclease [Candidatus Viridilinea halotolerans]